MPQLTGITNAMLRTAPPAAEVMRDAARFVGGAPMVAHNASFDSKFWQAELALAGLPAPQPFACTVLLSRRLYPQAPSHQLGTLVDYHGLPRTGQAHRALADAEMAASLLLRLEAELVARHQVAEVSHALLRTIQAAPKHQLERCLARHRQAAPADA